MAHVVRLAWRSFGHLLDFSPRKAKAGLQIRVLKHEFEKRNDGRALAGDYYRVGNDIRIAMSAHHG